MLRLRKKAWVFLILGLFACGERRDVRGLVLKVDQQAGIVTVSHEPIPGYMDAMVMPFTASRPQDLEGVRPGDVVQFRMTVSGGRTSIGRVKILSAAPAEARLRQSPAQSAVVAIGQAVPDFSLVDQNGRTVSLSSLRGQVVTIGFIYTRCPLPDYCPRVMTTHAALRDRFTSRLGTDLTLLTVTFDPQFDTSVRMKEYAARYGADLAGWHLLTGSRDDIARICALFGVEFWPEEGMITHTLQTVVIDRAGRLAAIVEGKDFSARALGDLVNAQLLTTNY